MEFLHSFYEIIPSNSVVYARRIRQRRNHGIRFFSEKRDGMRVKTSNRELESAIGACDELNRQAAEIFPKLSDMKRNIPPVLITFALVCLALVQNAQAVSPPPDGGYPGGNTGEGDQRPF